MNITLDRDCYFNCRLLVSSHSAQIKTNTNRLNHKYFKYSSIGLHLLYHGSYFCAYGIEEKLPPDFTQLYTIHAIHRDLPELMEPSLIAFALISNRDIAAYRQVFNILSLKMFEEFGGMGAPKVFQQKKSFRLFV